MLTVARLCKYTKDQWTVYFKRMNAMVCELDLNFKTYNKVICKITSSSLGNITECMRSVVKVLDTVSPGNNWNTSMPGPFAPRILARWVIQWIDAWELLAL